MKLQALGKRRRLHWIVALPVFVVGLAGRLLSDSDLPINSKYSDLKSKRMSEKTIITPVPSLVATLLKREQDKGKPLTRVEVETIRDQMECIVMTPGQRAAVDEKRGYKDIDPEKVWDAWQVARLDLVRPGS